MHRLLHARRGLYRLVHAHHHSVEAELSARTGLFISGLEALLLIGIPGAVLRIVEACTVHNELGARIAVLTQTQINVIGHIGGTFRNPLALLALNPFFIAIIATGTAQGPRDHQCHHDRPRTNMALYFRHWDEWLGTNAHVPGRAPSSPLLLAYNVVFYALLTALCSALWAAPLRTLAAAGAAAALLAALPAPAGGWGKLRRARFWDALRAGYACQIEGHAKFDPATRHIFAYHPHGALARGWWLTFGLQGRASPVAACGLRVRLATHRALLAVPGLKQALGAIGCCGVDAASLNAVLQVRAWLFVFCAQNIGGLGRQQCSLCRLLGPRVAVSCLNCCPNSPPSIHPNTNKTKTKQDPEPTSVALCPGGWDEGRYAMTDKVVLSKRRGFLRLAITSRAALVPVLAGGEAKVAKNMALGCLLPARAAPIRVSPGLLGSAFEGWDKGGGGDREALVLAASASTYNVHVITLDPHPPLVAPTSRSPSARPSSRRRRRRPAPAAPRSRRPSTR